MNKDHIHVTGRHIQVTEAMKQYAAEKLERVRTQDPVMDIYVVMDIEHLTHKVIIMVKFDHFKVKAEASSTDMYASIDKAVDRLGVQLHRWKDKIHAHRNKKLSVIDMKVNVQQRPYNEVEEYNFQIDAQNEKDRVPTHPIVEGRKTVPLKELTTEEAIMKIELSQDQFLIYRSEEDRKLKVMYKRKDGNYGIVEPE